MNLYSEQSCSACFSNAVVFIALRVKGRCCSHPFLVMSYVILRLSAHLLVSDLGDVTFLSQRVGSPPSICFWALKLVLFFLKSLYVLMEVFCLGW
jgi:hypothetical protein